MPLVGVKSLLSSGVSDVLQEYRRILHGSEDENAAAEGIPVVDLSGIEDDESKRAAVVDRISSACQQWGFFQVVGHGVPQELLSSMHQLVHDFFNLPAEQQMAYYSEDQNKTFRFGTSLSMANQNSKLWVDYLLQDCPPDDNEVPDFSNYKEVSAAYAQEMSALAKKLLGVFSKCLGLDSPSVLEKCTEKHLMKMNYYPPCPDPNVVMGSSEHSDSGGFTIPQQDNIVGGLQFLHNGKWINAQPVEGAFVINIADMMEVLTNGKFKSVVHRAKVDRSITRVSIASFHTPRPTAYIAPLRELVKEQPWYKGCTYGEYMVDYFANVFTKWSGLETIRLYQEQELLEAHRCL